MPAFSLALAFAAAIVFGIVPAFHATRPEFLRTSGLSSRRQTIGRLLMVAEINFDLAQIVQGKAIASWK
jgi:hypothetical protein